MRLAFLSIGRHIHTERWIKWFANRGHDCHLLTVQPGPVDGVTVHDITTAGPGKPVRYWRSLQRVKGLLRELQPDLLNTHFLTGYGYWGDWSGFRPNLLTVWGDDVYVTPFENPVKNWLARRALAHCDALTGDSRDILEVAATRLGADPQRAYRVLWGVDREVFRPEDAAAYRAELGFGPEHIVYFSPRSYTQPYYNIDTIVEAAAQVHRREARARFLFAGYEGDPTPFVQLVERAGLGDVARVVGRIPHDQFATALNAGDVFISVPSVDATAVSLLEAMSCGRAIIISSLPSSMEWVTDGRSGRVVEPRAVDGLVQAMLDYGADADLRRQHGQAALEVACREAGFEANMAHVDAIVRSLVTGEDVWPDAVSLPRLQQGPGGA